MTPIETFASICREPLSRRRALQAIAAAVAVGHATGLAGSAVSPARAAVAWQSPPTYAGIVGLI
jgi:hypothetical protein